ncbi:CLIP-associating protein 1 isoform X16 [Silurus meridionalis]|nr:CLIP-associating protein 1 isoform X16 [Silurus meridionalis]
MEGGVKALSEELPADLFLYLGEKKKFHFKWDLKPRFHRKRDTHTHYPRLIPILTSNCTSKSVAVRRRCYEFLDLLLQEWQTSCLDRHVAVLMETIKKGVHDADSEARSVARKCYWGFHSHFSKEAEQLFQALELTYQKALQSHLKASDSVTSLPQSDRSSSSSQESLNRPQSAKASVQSSITRNKVVSSRVSSTPGSLQRSRSDVDVNAAATAKSRMPKVPAAAPFSSAGALPPGSYASLELGPVCSPPCFSSCASSLVVMILGSPAQLLVHLIHI